MTAREVSVVTSEWVEAVSGIKFARDGCCPKQDHEAEHGARRRNTRKRTFSSTGLDDEDILSTDALFDLYTRLTALELVKQHLRWRYAEVVADGPARWSAGGRIIFPCCRDILSELRVRAPTEDDDVANHDESGGVFQSSLWLVQR